MTIGRVAPDRIVVLVAHGSRDPRAGASTGALARAVAVARPDLDVRVAFLEFEAPLLADVLVGLGDRPATVVPLLLTPAYHARTDLPAILAAAGARTDVTDVVGSVEPLLIAALIRRLRETFPDTRSAALAGIDGIVLAAAGSRDAGALAVVESVAAGLANSAEVLCRAGYVSGLGPTVAEAIACLRAQGARNIAMATHFLAPGVLCDRAVGEAMAAGVARIARPLGSAPEMIEIVSYAVDTVLVAA